MKSLLRVILGCITLIVALNFGSAEAAKWPDVCQGKPPHYLVGYKQTSDQIEVFQQLYQVYRASWADSGTRGYRAANFGEKTEMVFYSHKVILYLPAYRRMGNTVYFHTASGVTPLTNEEFECVKADLYEYIKTSIDADYEDHKAITTGGIESFAKRNGKTPDEVRALLAKSVPEYGTNYADILKIPQLEPIDFINGVKYMYFAPMRTCNAAVYLKTIVAFTPCLRRADFVMGHNETMKHELIHANAKLQGYPIGWYVNVELLAALLPFLEHPASPDTFFYHTYLMTPWEALKVFGCFDIEKVRNEIFRYRVPFDGAAMNEEVLRAYLPEINRAAQWLRESGLAVLAEYYSDPHVWATINNISYDDDMFYKVIMSKLYEPTCLGGHAKTTLFILKHTDESKDVARRAWEQVGKEKVTSDQHRAKMIADFKRLAETLGFTHKMLMQAARFYGVKPQDLDRLDPELLRQAIADYINREGVFQHLKEVR